MSKEDIRQTKYIKGGNPIYEFDKTYGQGLRRVITSCYKKKLKLSFICKITGRSRKFINYWSSKGIFII